MDYLPRGAAVTMRIRKPGDRGEPPGMMLTRWIGVNNISADGSSPDVGVRHFSWNAITYDRLVFLRTRFCLPPPLLAASRFLPNSVKRRNDGDGLCATAGLFLVNHGGDCSKHYHITPATFAIPVLLNRQNCMVLSTNQQQLKIILLIFNK